MPPSEAELLQARNRAKARRKQEADTKLEEREYLRHEIQARMHVQDLETIALILFSGKEAIAEDALDPDNISMVPLDKDRTAQLLGAAKVKEGLLKKVLPDIKAMELTGAGGEDLGTDRVMAEMELRNRLRAILIDQRQPALIDAQPESTYGGILD